MLTQMTLGRARSGCFASILALLGCGSHRATSSEATATAGDKLTLRPMLHPGDKFAFHVDTSINSTITAGSTLERTHATLKLDDQVEVVSASQIHDQFSNITVDGDGEIGDALRRVATVLPSATVTTRFDANWQISSSSIDGIQDDEARTMIMNLTPIVSFKMLSKDPVAIGDSWSSQWSEALRSEQGSATGKVATTVRYALRTVAACGTHRCATISSDGEDSVPSQDGMTGTSSFHGEVQVDLADLVPMMKSIVSKTTFRGEQHGLPFEYTNVVTVRVQRGDRSP